MKTCIIAQSDGSAIKETLNVIRSGGVVAVPTDTVYGIACSVGNSNAIHSLFQIKIRGCLKAIPVLIGDINQIDLVAKSLNENARKLAQSFWPGALTLIVAKNKSLPTILTIHPTVGVRIPDHGWLRAIILKTGPLAATSANISGETSPSTASQVLDQLNGRIELIIDGGECKGGISSTVVDCSGEEIKILREGGITPEQIQSALGK
ncbi:MAG: L-threonylcarbamoyladenylate synthase [Pelolinea sp.]|nr:L-threonylcarbamoyladenylate synthase [Pelolinea sp.]